MGLVLNQSVNIDEIIKLEKIGKYEKAQLGLCVAKAYDSVNFTKILDSEI